MGLLDGITTDDSINDEKDSVGSGGVLESGLYLSTITLAYLMKSAGGALGLVLNGKTSPETGGREWRQTLWMASGNAKGNKTYYEAKDGTKNYLPGFNHANSLALLTIGKEISELDTEIKVVNVYSPDAKAEVPTKVECPVELLGQEIIVGLIKQTVDKTAKDDKGNYNPTGETREENEIDKFFRARDSLTTAEIKAGVTEPGFIKTWEDKHAGKTRNKAKGASGAQGTAGVPGMVRPVAGVPGTQKPKDSIFPKAAAKAA